MHHYKACHINAATPTAKEPPTDTPTDPAPLGFTVGVTAAPEARSTSTAVPLADVAGAETEAESGAASALAGEETTFGQGFS